MGNPRARVWVSPDLNHCQLGGTLTAKLDRDEIGLAPYKDCKEAALAAYKDRNDNALATHKAHRDVTLEEYGLVVDQFRKLTEIRFRLLTCLPLGTGAAAFFVSKGNELEKHREISAFAFVVPYA